MIFFGYLRFLTGCEVREVHVEAATLFDGTHVQTRVEDVAVYPWVAPTASPPASTRSRCACSAHGHLLVDDERSAVEST